MLFSRIVNGWAGGTIRHTFARSDEGTALQRGLMWNYELVLPNQGVPFVMNAHDRCKGIWDGQEPPVQHVIHSYIVAAAETFLSVQTDVQKKKLHQAYYEICNNHLVGWPVLHKRDWPILEMNNGEKRRKSFLSGRSALLQEPKQKKN